MDPAVVALVPVFVLGISGRSITANEAVAEVVVVSVIVGCAQGRRHVEQNTGHAANVRRGHRSPGDGHVVEVALRTG